MLGITHSKQPPTPSTTIQINNKKRKNTEAENLPTQRFVHIFLRWCSHRVYAFMYAKQPNYNILFIFFLSIFFRFSIVSLLYRLYIKCARITFLCWKTFFFLSFTFVTSLHRVVSFVFKEKHK